MCARRDSFNALSSDTSLGDATTQTFHDLVERGTSRGAGSTCRVSDLGRPTRFVEEATGHAAVAGTGGVVEGAVRVLAGAE